MSLEITLEANTAALTAHTEVMRALLERLGAGNALATSAAVPVLLAAQVVASPEPAQADPAPVVAVAPAPVVAVAPTPVVAVASKASEPVTYDHVKPLILKINASKGRDAAMAALAKFGVAKGPDLKPEQYADFAAHAAEVLA